MMRVDLRDELRAAMREHGCVDCGATEELEWHHFEFPDVEPTSPMTLARLGQRERVLAEIQWCVVLCKTCHRARHKAWREQRAADGKTRFREDPLPELGVRFAPFSNG